MRWKSRRPPASVELPAAPVNVRIVHDDGSVTPLECVYDGLDSRGMHRWVAARPAHIDLNQPLHIQADEIPPRTGIVIGQIDLGSL